jgi:hypothetical protein
MSHAPSKIWRSPVKVILLAGITAGCLDLFTAILVYAVVLHKVPAMQLLQGIASGVFGKDAYSGGTTMAVFGIIFHFVIAFCWVIFYFILYANVAFLRKHQLVSGILYGFFIWAVMNLGVLPIVLHRRGPIAFDAFLVGALILVVMIGIPVSYIAKRYDVYHKWNQNAHHV